MKKILVMFIALAIVSPVFAAKKKTPNLLRSTLPVKVKTVKTVKLPLANKTVKPAKDTKAICSSRCLKVCKESLTKKSRKNCATTCAAECGK